MQNRFYLTVWGDRDVKEIIGALEKTLKDVAKSTEVPATLGTMWKLPRSFS